MDQEQGKAIKDILCDVALNYKEGLKCDDPTAEKDGNTGLLCTIIDMVRMGLGCNPEKHTSFLEGNKNKITLKKML